CDRARALLRPGAPPDGRTVRRPRRDDARTHEHGATAHLGGQRLDGRLRHTLDLRSGLPVDPRGGDVAASRPYLQSDLDRPAATAQRDDARGAALLRARNGSARGAASRPRPRAGACVSTTPAAVQPVPRGGMARLVGRRLTDSLPAAVVLVVG